MSWLLGHLRAHPARLFITCLMIVVTSYALAGYALTQALTASRDADIAVCKSVNELRRELYIAAADLGVDRSVRVRFLPTEDCESLP